MLRQKVGAAVVVANEGVVPEGEEVAAAAAARAEEPDFERQTVSVLTKTDVDCLFNYLVFRGGKPVCCVSIVPLRD
jgi:hypothetical protein